MSCVIVDAAGLAGELIIEERVTVPIHLEFPNKEKASDLSRRGGNSALNLLWYV